MKWLRNLWRRCCPPQKSAAAAEDDTDDKHVIPTVSLYATVVAQDPTSLAFQCPALHFHDSAGTRVHCTITVERHHLSNPQAYQLGQQVKLRCIVLADRFSIEPLN